MSQAWRHDAKKNNMIAMHTHVTTTLDAVLKGYACHISNCLCNAVCDAVMCHCSCDVCLSEIVTLFVFIQVQQENLQQAEELAAQATQIAAVKTDLQDTQKLLSALQSMITALGHNCQLHQVTTSMLHAELALLVLHTA